MCKDLFHVAYMTPYYFFPPESVLHPKHRMDGIQLFSTYSRFRFLPLTSKHGLCLMCKFKSCYKDKIIHFFMNFFAQPSYAVYKCVKKIND